MKKLLSIILMMVVVGTVSAQNALFKVTPEKIKVKPGEQFTLSISLENDIEFIGTQLGLYLPDGITVAETDDRRPKPMVILNTNRIDDHTANVTLDATDENGDKNVLIAIFSPNNYPFYEEEGELLSVTFNVDENISCGEKSFEIKNIVHTYLDASQEPPVPQGIKQSGINIPLTVYQNFNISATTANETMGSITIDGAGEEVESGTTVTATATPVSGYEFVNWTAGEEVVSTDNPYKFEASANVALVANFQAKKFPVSFVIDGKATTENLSFGSTVTTPENPTKEGYTFTGWEPEFVEGVTVPVDGLTYTATWKVNQYTITFNTNGGTAIEAITQDYGTEIKTPANPTKTGYTFAGWDVEIPATMPAKNQTITASWTINQYAVVFNVDGKETSSAMNYGAVIKAPETPSKEGYEFTGWEPEFKEGATVPEGGITYTATWKVNQYTITFDTDGGSEIAAITQNYGTEVKAPANPTKTGYTFAGWDVEIPATMPAKNQTITASWTINQYDVVFNVDGKEVSKTTQDFGTVITAPETPVKEGHTFAGWDPEYKEGATVPEGGITYTATWKVNQYTITFDTDGGSEIAAITQDYGTEVKTPANPTKTGYTFAGWDVEIPATMPAKDQTIKASWTINQYDVVFIVDGKEVSRTTQDFGTVITAPETPAKEGHTFAGWSPAFKEGDTVPEGGVVYTAIWQGVPYTITFDTDGGTEIAPITQDYGTEVKAPANPTKTGYTFMGWDVEIPETMPAENMTIKAIWKINQYDVVFIVDENVNKSTMDYGTVVTAPENPAKEGHTFTGWEPEFIEGITVPVNGLTYTAKWEVNKYTITFDTDGGTEIAAITQDYGTEVKTPANPTKTGYTFVGWDVEIPATMPAKNQTITASWTINQHVVKFVVDGVVVKETTQDYGTVITAPEDPSKTDFIFTGWDPEFVEGATVPDSAITYTAVWTANEVTITFDSNGGSAVASITQKPGTPVTAPADPTREYYTFLGWSENIPTEMPNKNITLVAMWQFNADELMSKFITYLSNIVIADLDPNADEIIMQPNLPFDYYEVKQAFAEAQEATSLQDAEELIAAYETAKDKLGVYFDYCCEIGNPRSYTYTLTEEWGTLVLPFKFVAPEGWTFYNITGLEENGTTLKLEEAENIQAKTPYLVNGPAGKNIQFIGHAKSNMENATNGLLTGVLKADYTAKDGEYVLQNQNGLTGFYRVNSTVATPAVNVTRCYLTLPETAAKARAFYLGDGATGIGSIAAEADAEQQIYNLSGQRQNRMTRGINIVNGKKVLVK